MIRGFGSDNFSGVLPEVFKALEEAAYGHQHSYEEDVYSEKAIQDFKNLLEKSGINVTIRREMGRDIGGACGQLRRSYKEASAVPQCTEGEG